MVRRQARTDIRPRVGHTGTTNRNERHSQVGGEWSEGTPLPQFSVDSGEDVRSRRSSDGRVVAMIQTAESWHRYDPATDVGLAHRFTTSRRSICR